MISRNQIKHIQALGCKKDRHNSGLFVAEGRKLVEEALQSGWHIEQVFCLEELENFSFSEQAIRISRDEMKKITQLSSPSEALAVLRMPRSVELDFNTGGHFLVLDGINDPGNLGTIIRIADWFGWKGVLCSEDTVDRFNPKVVQASMGSLFRVAVEYADLKERLQDLKKALIGASMEGSSVWNYPLPHEGCLLAIGSEAHGLRPDVRQLLTQTISIPGQGNAESLNAGVATGILVAALSR